MASDTARSRYEDLRVKREPYLNRARDCAKLTIPAILPPQGHNGSQPLPQPYQGLGSRAVTYLSSKMMTAMLPIGTNHFVLEVPTEILVDSGRMDVPSDVQKNLALTENMITSEIERKNWRSPTNITLQFLIVTGNACEYVAPDNTIKVYRLDNYVVARDLAGQLYELIVRDSVSAATLPENMRGMAMPNTAGPAGDNVDLFTWCRRRKDGTWEVKQELNDNPVPNSKKVVKTLPFLVYRYAYVPGEDYGRGKVEEHYADLSSLDALTKAMLDLSAMNARNLILIRPNATGQSLRKFVSEAENGATGVGNFEDVNLLRFENVAGAQIISAEIQRLYETLSTAFLLGSGLRRDAERVTATELRMVAEELEGALGGIYSTLAEHMQRGRLILLIDNMERTGRLPMISDVAEPVIIVGLEALSREQDAAKAVQLVNVLQGLPPEVLDYVKWEDMLKTIMIGSNLPAAVRSDDEVNQIRQQRAMAEAAQQAQAMGQAPQGAVA